MSEPPLFGRMPEQYFTRILAAAVAARDAPGPPGEAVRAPATAKLGRARGRKTRSS